MLPALEFVYTGALFVLEDGTGGMYVVDDDVDDGMVVVDVAVDVAVLLAVLVSDSVVVMDVSDETGSGLEIGAVVDKTSKDAPWQEEKTKALITRRILTAFFISPIMLH